MPGIQLFAEQPRHLAVESLGDVLPFARRVWRCEQAKVALIDDLEACVPGRDQPVDSMVTARLGFDCQEPRLNGLPRDLLQHQRLGAFEIALEEMRDAVTTEQVGDRYTRNADWCARNAVAFGNLAEQAAPAVLVEANVEWDGRTRLFGRAASTMTNCPRSSHAANRSRTAGTNCGLASTPMTRKPFFR